MVSLNKSRVLNLIGLIVLNLSFPFIFCNSSRVASAENYNDDQPCRQLCNQTQIDHHLFKNKFYYQSYYYHQIKYKNYSDYDFINYENNFNFDGVFLCEKLATRSSATKMGPSNRINSKNFEKLGMKYYTKDKILKEIDVEKGKLKNGSKSKICSNPKEVERIINKLFILVDVTPQPPTTTTTAPEISPATTAQTTIQPVTSNLSTSRPKTTSSRPKISPKFQKISQNSSAGINSPYLMFLAFSMFLFFT